MAKQCVGDLKDGGRANSHFGVVKKKAPQSYARGYRFILNISDKTGEIELVYWGGDNEDEVDQVYRSFDEGDVIEVTNGGVSSYNGKMQISINPPLGRVSRSHGHDPKDFLKTSTRDIDGMKAELVSVIEGIVDADTRRLLTSFVEDAEFFSRYAQAPAAKTHHHNYVGGLLEHVLDLVLLANGVVAVHPELDRGLLVAGCILHDIGKVVEYKIGATIGFTREGELLGHISIGYKMVADRMERLDTPEILRQKILHMILSHHGKQEWGSPVVPKFPEALALHHIDNISAKIKGILQEIENHNPEDEWLWTKNDGRMFLK